jgi:hypothetical protein
MRRGLTLAVAVLALLGVLAPPVFAQAPAPKVTVNGLIDSITTFAKNNIDGNYADGRDSSWQARSRGVFTFTGEVGKAKGVLALEIDLGWGQVSNNESIVSNSGQTLSSSAGQIGSQQNAFQQGAFDLGNDVGGVIEIKNLYVEFPVPLIPIPTVVRLGGQPFQTTMKGNVIATTDYGGLWLQTTITPNIKFNLTYAQAEEDSTGQRTAANFYRGDDFFIMPSVTVTPFKGLDVMPFVGWYHIYGNSHNQSRCRVQCAGLPSNGVATGINQMTGAVTTASTGNYKQNSQEERYYFGIDNRFTAGPFYLDPTIIFEHSNAEVYQFAGQTTPQLSLNAAGTAVVFPATLPGQLGAGGSLTSGLTQAFGQRFHQDINSWLIDIRGGWRLGPLLLEGMAMWTPGDKANHDSFKNSRVYHPVNVDIGYASSWSEILSLGTVDYFYGQGHGMGENVGLGRYGRKQVGARVTYSVTPAFDVNFKTAAAWTDTLVDIDAPQATPFAGGSFGAVPCAFTSPTGAVTSAGATASPFVGGLSAAAGAACASTNMRGEKDFIGAEVDLGLTYRFAPGLTFDTVYGHLFSGGALTTTFFNIQGALERRVAPHDVNTWSARVRYQF